MAISFEDGRDFRLPNSRRGGPARYSAEEMRRAIEELGQFCEGEVILMPPVTELAASLGVSHTALYDKRVGSYEEAVRCVTGLEVIRHSGLILLGSDTYLEPLQGHLQ